MTSAGKTFSESWHRVAGLKIALRPTVHVRKQFFRGEKWYILEDPYNNSFFRLRPQAHNFVSRLRPSKTVEEVWMETVRLFPETAPGQEDLIQLLAQLYFANLLYYEMPPDSVKLFERYQSRKQREIKSKLLSIMFIRIPLIDPDKFLKRFNWLFKIIFSPIGAIICLAVMFWAVKLVIENFSEAMEQAQGILAPGNLFLLYLSLIIIKTLHEFGHAAVCTRYGGEVHTMGVMLLVFTPLPFMDATSSWAFRSRFKRALVGAAGMMVELFVAGLAVYVWANTGPGRVHSLAYNMMFIASVSTLLFNGNPLLRFDGYYILSDLLDIPNLTGRAMQQLRHVIEKYIFGWKNSISAANTVKEAILLSVFGTLSTAYRVIVFTGIILFVADKFLLAGLIMAAFLIFSWVLVPLFRFVSYLSASPRLARTRIRAVSITVAFFAFFIAFLGVFPYPDRFRAPGVLEAVEYIRVVNDSPGYVEKILLVSGSRVILGQELILIKDYELDLEIEASKAQHKETKIMERRALRLAAQDLEPIKKRLETIEKKLQELEKQRSQLVVRAKEVGIWVAPRANEMVGAWIPRGSVVGQIIDPSAFRFSAIVSQDEASSLFPADEKIEKSEVRLFGQGGVSLLVDQLEIIPYKHETLPSAALGWLGGGEVAVSISDETGLMAQEPFFQIYANLINNDRATLLHGQSGKIRFNLGHQPLLKQWTRSIRQLLQKRYQI